MKIGTWVQIVFYRGNHRFVVRGKLAHEYTGNRDVPYMRSISLKSVQYLNGYEPRNHELGMRYGFLRHNTTYDVFIPSMKIVHIRKLSKDVALAMEL